MKSSAEANTRNQLDNSTVYYHRLNRRIQLEYIGLSGDTEPAAGEQRAPVDPTLGFELRRFNRRPAPDDPTKSMKNTGVVVQRSNKMSRADYRFNRC